MTVPEGARPPYSTNLQANVGAIFVHQREWRGIALSRIIGPCTYTHVGLLVRQGEQWMVIHSTPDKEFWTAEADIAIVPLTAFLTLQPTSRADVFEVEGLSSTAADEVTNLTRRWSTEGRPFDHDFAYSTDDALYCTELIDKAFDTVGHPLLADRGSLLVRAFGVKEPVLKPDTLAQSPRLRLVENLIQP